MLVSADALHTQRAHARYLVEDKNVDYLLTVKDNQPTLFSQLNAYPGPKYRSLTSSATAATAAPNAAPSRSYPPRTPSSPPRGTGLPGRTLRR